MNTKAEVFPIFSLSLDISHPTSHHSKNCQVFQFPPKGAGMQKNTSSKILKYFLPARQPFDFPLRCFTDAERPKPTLEREANPKLFPMEEENPMT